MQKIQSSECKKLQYAESQKTRNELGVAYVNLEGVNPFRVGGLPPGSDFLHGT
jgi:hypothetical protein